MAENLLKIEDLTIQYVTHESGVCRAVNHVDLQLRKGETLGLVGETGAGKTTIARGIMRLVAAPAGRVTGGRVMFQGEDLYQLPEKQMRKIRGNKISMIFQDPMTALNPIDTVGAQISEVIRLHQEKGKEKDYLLRAAEMMEMIGIPRERFSEYPHQFSGGMKQRIVIAMALACNPDLLIADEPTTALDVTIQAQILDMISKLKRELGTSMLLITHDLGVVAAMCDTVAIIYAGEIVEYGTAAQIYKETRHPYTQGLFASLPSLTGDETRLKPIMGMTPDPTDLPAGCKFAPRCPYAAERCHKEEPPMMTGSDGHQVRCFLTTAGTQKG